MRRGLCVAVLLSAFAALAPDAGAHAQLVGSRPADGATVARAPRELELRFNEAISPRFRVVRVIDGHGRAVRATRLRGTDGGHGLAVAVPRLPRGPYQVSWEVLAQADGHVTGGAVGFGVASRPAGGAAVIPGATAPAADAWWRALDLLAQLALTGLLAMVAVLAVAGPGASLAAITASRRLLLGAAAVATGTGLMVGPVLLVRQLDRLQSTVAPGIGLGGVFGTRWGALWSARELLLAALLTTVLLLRGRDRGGPATVPAGPAAGALLVALAVVRALAGHAAADHHAALAVAVATAHVLAAGAWLGGLAALALMLGRAVGRGEARALAAACRRTIARGAAAAAVALAVTGLLAAGQRVVSVDALLTTDYGRTLMTKCALVAGAAAVGLGNAWALRRGRPPRLLAVELALGLGVVLAAATLTASPPARGPEFAAPRPSSPANLIGRDADLVVTVTARPNRPGPNVVTLTAVSTRRPPPAPVTGAQLRLARRGEPPQTIRLSQVGPGRFAGGANLDLDGRRRMAADISRGGRRVAVPFAWTVGPPDPARPVTYSARRLAPLLDRAALLIVLALAAAGAAAAVRRTRGPLAPTAIPAVEPAVKEAP